ncbi:Sigma-70 family RNA polymerase sigma factor, partial [Dysosmobacter welbionis]
ATSAVFSKSWRKPPPNCFRIEGERDRPWGCLSLRAVFYLKAAGQKILPALLTRGAAHAILATRLVTRLINQITSRQERGNRLDVDGRPAHLPADRGAAGGGDPLRGLPGGEPGAVHHGVFGAVPDQSRHRPEGDQPAGGRGAAVQETGRGDVCGLRRPGEAPPEPAGAVL